MEGEITCQAGEIYKVHEKKKEKGIVKKNNKQGNNLYRGRYNSPFGCADSGLCNDDSRCMVDYR